MQHLGQGPPIVAMFAQLNDPGTPFGKGSDYVFAVPNNDSGATLVVLGTDGEGSELDHTWMTLPTVHDGATMIEMDGDIIDELVFGADEQGTVRLIDAPTGWLWADDWCSVELFDWPGASILLGADLDGLTDDVDELIVSDGEELRIYSLTTEP